MMERCDKTDLLKPDCSHCRGMDPSPNVARKMEARQEGGVEGALVHEVDDDKWFIATHYGECDNCFKKIKPGDRIKWGDGYPGARVCCSLPPCEV